MVKTAAPRRALKESDPIFRIIVIAGIPTAVWFHTATGAETCEASYDKEDTAA